MKKLLAVLCAAAMLVVSCVPSFAAGSGTPPADQHGKAIILDDGTAVFPDGVVTTNAGTTTPASQTTQSTQTSQAASTSTTQASTGTSSTAQAPASTTATTGDTIDVTEAKASDYPDGSKANAVAKAIESAGASTASVLEAMGVTGGTITTAGGKQIDVSKLSLLSKLLKFVTGSGKTLPSGKFRAKLPANQSLVGKKADEIVNAQIGVKTGKIDWVDCEDVSATGEQTATFMNGSDPFLVFGINK
ncbi:MAG: hypothetical protein IKE58_08405 [Blautia sp.]|nr:hypothetical protein [Blautia sp.]